MGGGSDKGAIKSSEDSQSKLAGQLSGLLSQQEGQSNQLFNLAFPGLQQSTDFYSALASGSPNLLAAVTAPAAQKISEATAGAKQNILQTSPAGGERNLAIEQADVAQGAQLGALASQGYTGSFNALASLGGQGVGQSQSAVGNAISAGGSAESAYSNLVNEHIQQKGAQLGAFGSLAGNATSLATSFL